MRGELCQFFAVFLSFAALVMAIFVHIGQIEPNSISKGIYMVKINTSEYANTLSAAISTNVDRFDDIYTYNATAPLNEEQGLRQLYLFGLYSHCAFVNQTAGICSPSTVGVQYRPYDDLTGDMPRKHSTITDALISGPIRESFRLGAETKGAYWCILIGTVLSLVAPLTGWRKHGTFFLISTSSSIIGSVALLCGAAIWTDAVKKTESLNSATVGNNVPLGLEVSIGTGLYLLWGSFAALFLSVIPYMLSCCTWRG